MSDLVLTRSAPGNHRRASALWQLGEFIISLRLAFAMAHRYDALSNLSDAELSDRGLRREDIPRMVVNRRYDV